MELSVMPECYADTLLIETLVPPVKRYNHKHSCTQVEREMVKGKLRDKFAVGIVDKDKRAIKYLNEFIEIDRVENFLILFKHRSKEKPHFIIQIIAALEQWILNICEEEKITLENLPTEIEEFKKYTKKQSSIYNEDLKSLFYKMAEKNNNCSIRKLKSWLRLLLHNNYNVDLNELKNG